MIPISASLNTYLACNYVRNDMQLREITCFVVISQMGRFAFTARL